MKEITTLGIDLAKNIFQLHGVDRTWQTRAEEDGYKGQASGDPGQFAALSCGPGGLWWRAPLGAQDF